MPEFRYTVIDAKGQTISGMMEADSKEICRKIIAQRGLYCLSISEANLATRSLSFGGNKVKAKELSIFCRQFSTMLISGIGVIKALDILHSQAESPRLKAVLKGVYDSVQRGQSLSAALNAQNTFPDLLINMVEAGEAGGTLDEVMGRLADYYEKMLKTANKVKGALMYPIILSILTVVVVIFLLVGVLPVFMDMFSSSGAPLPLPTRILVGISNSLTTYWYIYLVVISLAILLWMQFIKREKGRLWWDRFKTRMPVAGKLNVIIISARFARTLSAMVQSGIPILKSLEITSKVMGNSFYAHHVMEIRDDIRKGASLSASLKKTGIFPVMLLSMINVGEESGNLDSVLMKTSNFYDEESDAAVSRLLGILEPLLIIVMAGVIGFIVVSIMMPMYGMMTLIN